jgi:DNA excision repair protein ERCC-3
LFQANMLLPLIVQNDYTLLLEVKNSLFSEARDAIAPFAEIEKSLESIHTFRMTPLSLWNAASIGMTSDEMIAILEGYSKYGVPRTIEQGIREYVHRYGLLQLVSEEGRLYLVSKEQKIMNEVLRFKAVRQLLGIGDQIAAPDKVEVPPEVRGTIKQELIRLGYPVQDLIGYEDGTYLNISLLPVTKGGLPFRLRDYQENVVDTFYAQGSNYGGNGVLCLPCGAGKTIIGLGVMAKAQTETLILTSNSTSVRQWVREILDKTNLSAEEVGEYTGEKKEVRPVTVATYQIITYRPDKDGEFPHFKLFNERNWGLIIYDEVHLLPAPVFRVTADIQAKRRLGLTATLVREDGREEDVFSLIGPKKVDMPWKDLERQGWIAEAECIEIRIPMEQSVRERYRVASDRNKYRIAAENPRKNVVLKHLLEQHHGDQTIIIGQYVDQLEAIAQEVKAPIISGRTPQQEREELYKQFRNGEIKVLVVSKVANFAIDLPDANVAIQVSGTFGSRQEEAQRIGRVLRPKAGNNRAYFYTLVTLDSKDQEYAIKRQLFLVEQGYSYKIKEILP